MGRDRLRGHGHVEKDDADYVKTYTRLVVEGKAYHLNTGGMHKA